MQTQEIIFKHRLSALICSAPPYPGCQFESNFVGTTDYLVISFDTPYQLVISHYENLQTGGKFLPHHRHFQSHWEDSLTAGPSCHSVWSWLLGGREISGKPSRTAPSIFYWNLAGPLSTLLPWLSTCIRCHRFNISTLQNTAMFKNLCWPWANFSILAVCQICSALMHVNVCSRNLTSDCLCEHECQTSRRERSDLLSTTGTAVAGLLFSPSMISGALSP